MGCTSSTRGAVEAPKLVEGDFKIHLERHSQEALGLAIHRTAEAAFVVSDVRESGLVPAWNKGHENTPELMVREGDVIVGVNSIVRDLDAMEVGLAQSSITLLIRRDDRLMTAEVTDGAPLLLGASSKKSRSRRVADKAKAPVLPTAVSEGYDRKLESEGFVSAQEVQPEELSSPLMEESDAEMTCCRCKADVCSWSYCAIHNCYATA